MIMTACMTTNIFDTDKIDYDNVRDLWYSWLYSRPHYLIVKNVIRRYNTEPVLDLGCGTGFQTFLHTRTGSSVVG
jgi:SAM-dependent methyltransferase